MVGGGVMAAPVADVLTRVADLTGRIGPLLVELLNHPDAAEQAEQLRVLGQHVGSLSAELLARAAELDGRVVEQPERVVIDARVEP